MVSCDRSEKVGLFVGADFSLFSSNLCHVKDFSLGQRLVSSVDRDEGFNKSQLSCSEAGTVCLGLAALQGSAGMVEFFSDGAKVVLELVEMGEGAINIGHFQVPFGGEFLTPDNPFSAI